MEIGCGKPKRALPRVTMLDPNTRFSTGTRIGDGAGGAVRAAASAGDSMREPATQATIAATPMAASTDERTVIRFPAMIYPSRNRHAAAGTDITVNSGSGMSARVPAADGLPASITTYFLLDGTGEHLLLDLLLNRLHDFLGEFMAFHGDSPLVIL